MKTKKILLISTGGTIGMAGSFRDRAGAKPVLDGKELMKMLPPFKKKISVDIHEFGNFPSPHITLEHAMKIRELILSKQDIYDGFVITHGTDTLEETAYFLDLTIKKKRPVVMTAAMRSSNELGLDGPRNLYSAIKVAANNEAYKYKVMVVVNDEIFDAKTVKKTDTSNISSFSSLDMGILGVVDEDRIIFYRQRHFYEFYDIRKIIEDIYLVKLYMGADSVFIDACVKKGASGIVIEALGRGNVPPACLPGIEKALKKGMPVLIVSRAFQGRVLDVYGYKGGGRNLKEMGCIFGGSLSGPKARIKLAVLLSNGVQPSALAGYFRND